jgi:HSP20 family protein
VFNELEESDMAIGDLVPWRWGGLRAIDEDRTFGSLRSEMEALHRNIDRVFGDLWRGPSLLNDGWTSAKLVPSLDVTEDDKGFNVSVELPGMDEKDVAVSVRDRVLTIRGEKKEEKEKKEKDVYRSERAYGSFRRVMELPADVDAEKIEASFKKGVLTIALPKSKEAQAKVKQIPVKAA